MAVTTLLREREIQKKKGKNISNILIAEMKFVRNDNRSMDLYKIINDQAVPGRVNVHSVNADIEDEQLIRSTSELRNMCQHIMTITPAYILKLSIDLQLQNLFVTKYYMF